MILKAVVYKTLSLVVVSIHTDSIPSRHKSVWWTHPIYIPLQNGVESGPRWGYLEHYLVQYTHKGIISGDVHTTISPDYAEITRSGLMRQCIQWKLILPLADISVWKTGNAVVIAR